MDSLDLLRSATLLDVRAESEYQQGAIPDSVNLPILNDHERTAVGTAYKEQGQAVATELGHALVSGDLKAARIDGWISFLQKNPTARLTCWRGGQRSSIAQAWLQQAGYDVAKVAGGYKALRQTAIRVLEEAASSRREPKSWYVIAGKTGTAKTKLINRLPNSIDLEGLANHRGSAFGAQTTPQPALATFENSLARAFLNHSPSTLVLEDESRTIGRIAVPESWHERMRSAPLALVEASLQTRVMHIRQEYVVDALQEQAAEVLATHYQQALGRIQRRLGGKRYKQISELLADAFNERRDHADWIEYLLTNYYDPMYEYQLQNKVPRITFRGDFDAVLSYLENLPPTA